MTARRVGFIGLGSLGRPMALRLLEAGYEMVVHNRSRGVVEAFVRLGAVAARSPREVGQQTDLVLTALFLPSSIEEVYLGTDGLLAAARPDLICVDHSTVEPGLSHRLAVELATRGAALLDAPVSGGPEGAAAGTLAIMVGGPRAAFERVRSVLPALGKRIVYCGPSGAGSAVKLVNQLLVTIHAVAAAEALTFAQRSGVDPELALETVSAGLGGSAMLTRSGPRILNDDFEPGARIELLLKDAVLVRELCAGLRLDLPLFFRAKQTLEAAFELGAGTSDLAAVVTAVRASNASSDRPVGPGETRSAAPAHSS
jgi:3-hydroxyisobutyrate dehydrogenase-like beta-hydroxyacid dehydrogenase